MGASQGPAGGGRDRGLHTSKYLCAPSTGVCTVELEKGYENLFL